MQTVCWFWMTRGTSFFPLFHTLLLCTSLPFFCPVLSAFYLISFCFPRLSFYQKIQIKSKNGCTD